MVPADNGTFNNNPGSIVDECDSEYELHDGVLVIPVMGDTSQKPVVVRLHPPYTRRVSRFEYARTKTPPVVPTPNDTQLGDKYLGGMLQVAAPKQNSNGELVYRVKGSYNFLVDNDVRMHGQVRFDAHGYETLIDWLGLINAPDDETWVSPYFDLNLLASNRILG